MLFKTCVAMKFVDDDDDDDNDDVGKPSATGQPTRPPTQPFILPGSINE